MSISSRWMIFKGYQSFSCYPCVGQKNIIHYFNLYFFGWEYFLCFSSFFKLFFFWPIVLEIPILFLFISINFIYYSKPILFLFRTNAYSVLYAFSLAYGFFYSNLKCLCNYICQSLYISWGYNFSNYILIAMAFITLFFLLRNI